MTFLIPPTGGPGKGLHFGQTGSVTLTNSTGGAVSLGEIVAVDPGDTANTATPGNDSRYAIAITPDAQVGLFYGVVTKAGANNADIQVAFTGRFQNVAITGTPAAGSRLASTGSDKTLQAVQADDLCIAYSETAGVGGLVDVVFDGINGFGQGGGS